MRFRPVRPNIYLPVIRFGVLVGDWKYILAATLVGYLVPFFFRLKLGIRAVVVCNRDWKRRHLVRVLSLHKSRT